MAGKNTDIISITAPSSVAAGEIVPVTVRIKNRWDYILLIAADIAYDTIPFLHKEYWIPSGETHSFSGSFTMPDTDVTIHVSSSFWLFGDVWELDDEMSRDVSLAEVVKGTISKKELEYDGVRASIPVYDIPQNDRGLVHIWGRNDTSSNQKMGINWLVYDPDGVVVEEYSRWEAFWTGPGNAQEFIGDRFDLDKVGTYTINIALSMNPDNPEIVDTYYGDMCTVGVVIPPEWSIIGSDITLAISVIPEVPPEWSIIGSDITLHVSLITVGWQIIGDDITLVVNTPEVPPPPCTPGETKCIGPDLYQCSLEEEWVLIEENSPVCVVEEKEEFPWLLLVAGGLGAAALVAATTKEKKPAKEKRA